MIRTQIYIPEDLHRQALLASKVRRINFSTLVRQSLKKFVVEPQKVKKKTRGLESIVGIYKGKKKVPSAIEAIRDYYLHDVV